MLRPVLLLLLLAPPFAAAAPDGPDFVVELAAGAEPVYRGPEGWVRLVEARAGERYAWNLSFPNEYTVGEFRIRDAFDVERREQVVPMLENVPSDRYPLFEPFPDDEVWDVEGSAQVYRHLGTGRNFTLRLGFPSEPATLVLQRDVTPPKLALGPVRDVTHFSFYQETTTDELALADLRVRPKGGGEWVENPTPSFHFIQKFPIQGLRADTEYEAQVLFRDWAGNNASSPVYTVRTAPSPKVPFPIVTVLEPALNATLPNGSVVFRASIDANGSTMEGGDIRFFLDKREVREGLRFEGGVFSYAPPAPLEPGFHSASIEATNAAGGRSLGRWSFTVASADAPASGAALLVPALVAAALLLRRR